MSKKKSGKKPRRVEPMVVGKFELKVWPKEGEPFTIDGEGLIMMLIEEETPAKALYKPGRATPVAVANTGEMRLRMEAAWIHEGLCKKFTELLISGLRPQ